MGITNHAGFPLVLIASTTFPFGVEAIVVDNAMLFVEVRRLLDSVDCAEAAYSQHCHHHHNNKIDDNKNSNDSEDDDGDHPRNHNDVDNNH